MDNEVFAPHLGRNVKFGWKPASDEVKAKTLKFANYHLAELPTPPSGPLNYTAKSSGLSKVFMNDQLGCCVISAYYHIKCQATSLTGTEFVASDQQIVNDYGHIGGYNGTARSDQGCDIPTALNWWKNNPDQAGTKILGYLAVDASNLKLCRQLIYLFGNLYGGVGLPADWVGNDMPQADGFVWDVAGRSIANNGHCIPFLDYDTNPSKPGLETDTWALKGTVTDAGMVYFTENQGGELYVILTPDWVDKAKQIAPNSIAWEQLIQDFDSQGGDVPDPGPGPSPVPPVPPTPPTPSNNMDLIWDMTAKTVTVPTGMFAFTSPLPVGFTIPTLNLVVLPTGWSIAGSAPSVHEQFDITSILTFITTYVPTLLAAIQAIIGAFQKSHGKLELPPGFHEVKPPTA